MSGQDGATTPDLVEDAVGYVTEYAKSGRSTCQVCKDKIQKGIVRLGVEVPNPYREGATMPLWGHPVCVFKRLQKPGRPGKTGNALTSVDDIKGYEDLKEEDQGTLKKLVEAHARAVENVPEEWTELVKKGQFWKIAVLENVTHTSYGNLVNRQDALSMVKEHSDVDEAEAYKDKMIQDKLKKGYQLPGAETEEPEEQKSTNEEDQAKEETPVEFLVFAGLSEAEANTVVDVAGITSMKDFRLLDDEMLKEVTKEAGLKLVPAKKLSNAVADLNQKKGSKNKEKEAHTEKGAASTAAESKTSDDGKSKETVDGEGKKAEDKEAAPDVHVFQCEYAKSNRSRCKGCNDTIDKGILRIAKVIDNPFVPRKDPDKPVKMPVWYHLECFWSNQRKGTSKKTRLTDASELEGLESLKQQDQKMLEARIQKENEALKSFESPAKEPASAPSTAQPAPEQVYLEATEGEHNKWWGISKIGASTKTRWGDIGEEGHFLLKEFGNEDEATTYLKKMVTSKLARSYELISVKGVKIEAPDRENRAKEFATEKKAKSTPKKRKRA